MQVCSILYEHISNAKSLPRCRWILPQTSCRTQMFSNLPVQSWKKYSGILGLKSWPYTWLKGGWRFYKSQLETLENQGKIAKGETMTHICFCCLLYSFSSGRPWHIKQREWRWEICKSHMTTVRYHNLKSVALSHGGLLKAQSETDTLGRLSDKSFQIVSSP